MLKYFLLLGIMLTSLSPVFSQEDEPAILFDDFSYTDTDELSANGWIIRTEEGWPGVPGAIWNAEAVTIEDHADEPDNRVVQMVSTTDGTTTTQTQLCHARKFYEGTYASRVHFTNEPRTGEDGDQIVQTFYMISPLEYDLAPNYSEMDFEYLPNGGWGMPTNVLFSTTWESFRPEPNWVADNTSDWIEDEFSGWHTLVIQVANEEVKYYVDGELFGEHGDEYYPEEPMSFNYNLWFIRGGQINSDELREYVEQIDWAFYVADTILSPEEVEAQVAALREDETSFIDTVPATDLESPCNF